jgi:hypothetical protein
MGRESLAPRVAWVLTNGEIPAGAWVLHSCDNPACVKPEHLFLGDHRDNMRDMAAKGRHLHGRQVFREKTRGSKHWHAKLDEVDVAEIRRLYAAGANTTELRDLFRCRQSTIWLIVHRKQWRHVL